MMCPKCGGELKVFWEDEIREPQLNDDGLYESVLINYVSLGFGCNNCGYEERVGDGEQNHTIRW